MFLPCKWNSLHQVNKDNMWQNTIPFPQAKHRLLQSRNRKHVPCFHRVLVSLMVMHLYSAFSMWIYSNALYYTLWGTLPYGAVHNRSNVSSSNHRCPQNRMSDTRPQHRELHALLFTISVWVF